MQRRYSTGVHIRQLVIYRFFPGLPGSGVQYVKQLPIVFEIRAQPLRNGQNHLRYRSITKNVFYQILSKQVRSFGVAGRTESLLTRKRYELSVPAALKLFVEFIHHPVQHTLLGAAPGANAELLCALVPLCSILHVRTFGQTSKWFPLSEWLLRRWKLSRCFDDRETLRFDTTRLGRFLAAVS